MAGTPGASLMVKLPGREQDGAAGRERAMPSKRIAIAVAIVVVGLIVLRTGGSVWFCPAVVSSLATSASSRPSSHRRRCSSPFRVSTGALWMSEDCAALCPQSVPWLRLPTGSPLQLLGSSPRFPWRLACRQSRPR